MACSCIAHLDVQNPQFAISGSFIIDNLLFRSFDMIEHSILLSKLECSGIWRIHLSMLKTIRYNKWQKQVANVPF